MKSMEATMSEGMKIRGMKSAESGISGITEVGQSCTLDQFGKSPTDQRGKKGPGLRASILNFGRWSTRHSFWGSPLNWEQIKKQEIKQYSKRLHLLKLLHNLLKVVTHHHLNRTQSS
jgi:hypothetical protein